MKSILLSFCLFTSLVQAETLSGNFELKKSSVKYLVTYLIKKAEAESTAAKGKGECKNATCEFLVAAPVKSFVSKDSGRDLNMLNVTNASKFPLAVVKVSAKSDISSGKMLADLEVEFAGVKKTYPGISFDVKTLPDGFHVFAKIKGV